ncbi:MAG TPA: cell envelope integrity protein TolA [Thioploca sp.]|nr:cell envelope integrity protein TolA [Thioploca sp.]
MRTIALIKAVIINILFLLPIFFGIEVLNQPSASPVLEDIIPATIVDEVVLKKNVIDKPVINLELDQIRKRIIFAKKLLNKTKRRKRQEEDILNKILAQKEIEAKKLTKERKKYERLKTEERLAVKNFQTEEKRLKQGALQHAEKVENTRIKKIEKRDEEQIQATIKLLQNKLPQYWIRPRGFYGGLSCIIKINLQIGGVVENVAVVVSSGNITFDHSAILAVQNASPLPIPDELYAEFREFNFEFKK